jgi:hypothetical protein
VLYELVTEDTTEERIAKERHASPSKSADP